jgi:hypothetical protein
VPAASIRALTASNGEEKVFCPLTACALTHPEVNNHVRAINKQGASLND